MPLLGRRRIRSQEFFSDREAHCSGYRIRFICIWTNIDYGVALLALVNRRDNAATRLRKRMGGACSTTTNRSGRLVETASMPSYSATFHLLGYNFIIELLRGENLLKTNSVLCLDSRERTAIQFQNRSNGLVALGYGEYSGSVVGVGM